jgi:hypothetical protein
MPLASDARPRGGAREGGKGGALRWSAPIEKTSRPEPEKRRRGTRRYAEGGAPEFQQSGARGTPSLSGRDTRGGRGARVGGHDGGRGDSSRGDAAMSDHRGSDGSNTWGEEEHFDRAFAALAEEMEHELVEMSPSPVPSHRVARRGGRQHDTDRSLETETEYASTEGLPDASQFRAASRVAVGRFIREFRGVDGASDWKRGDTTHDDDVLSASPVFNLGRGARARRNGDAVASTSAASSRLSDEWHSPSKRERGDDNVRRSGGFLAASTDDTDLDIAWARWGGGRGITIVETDPVASAAGTRPTFTGSADPTRSGKGGVGAPFGDANLRRDDEDILEAWRRQRRQEALEMGDGASNAARAAAAVAALEVDTGGTVDLRYQRGVSVDDAPSRKPESPPAPARRRTSPEKTPGRAVAVAVQTDADLDTAVTTPSRARRSLEFQEKRRDDERLNASARTRSGLSTSPGFSPPSSPVRGEGDYDYVSVSAPESTTSTSGAATPETPSPHPSPGRRLDRKHKQALEKALATLDIAAAIDVTVGDALFGLDDDDDGEKVPPACVPKEPATAGRALAGVGLPQRPVSRVERVGADINRRVSPSSKPPRPDGRRARREISHTGLSPIEAVAAEVPDRLPSVRVASQVSGESFSAAANPWLPSLRVAASSAPRASKSTAVPVPPSPASVVSHRDVNTPSPTKRLGEEWSRPEDEDDGLVVMLAARVANLEAQIARALAPE